MNPIDRKIVIDLYNEMVAERGKEVSFREIAEELASRGVFNTDTRKPYTLSTMYYILSRTPEGKKNRKQQVKKQPLLILMRKYPKISQWMVDNLEGEVIDEFAVTPEIVKGKHVYGFADVPSMMGASKMWWVCRGNSKVLITEDEIPEDVTWRQVEIRVLY